MTLLVSITLLAMACLATSDPESSSSGAHPPIHHDMFGSQTEAFGDRLEGDKQPVSRSRGSSWKAWNKAIVWLLVSFIAAQFIIKQIPEAVTMLACFVLVIEIGTLPLYNDTRQCDNYAIETPGQAQVCLDGLSHRFGDIMMGRRTFTSAPILQKWHWAPIVVINMLTIISSISIVLLGNRCLTGRIIGQVSDPAAEGDLAPIITAILAFMVVSQLLFSYTCRDVVGIFVRKHFFENSLLHAAFIGSSALTFGVRYIPGHNHHLGMQRVPLHLLIISIAQTPILVLGHEITKAVFKVLHLIDEPAAPPDHELVDFPERFSVHNEDDYEDLPLSTNVHI